MSCEPAAETVAPEASVVPSSTAEASEDVELDPGAGVRLESGWDKREVMAVLADIEAKGEVAMAADVAVGLGRLLVDPSTDEFEPVGELRAAFVRTLGALGDPAGVQVLIQTVRQPHDAQPVALHKLAIDELARFAPPSDELIDELLMVMFRVPDVPSTQNIGERAKRALVAFGEASVPRTLLMLRLQHEGVNGWAAENGVDADLVKGVAVSFLASIGSATATEAVLAEMPMDGCGARRRKPPVENDPVVIGQRAMFARALGNIGDPRAVPALCSCRDASHDPADTWEIATALGRIGGPEARACLERIVKTGEYQDTLPELRYEIRWEAARFAILASGPSDVRKLRKLLAASRDKTVRAKSAQWEPGLATLEHCSTDPACYARVLDDDTAPGFAREVAATQLSQLSPKDAAAALLIAQAFRVPDPDARVTMALLTRETLDGTPCPECAAALKKVMDRESGSAKAEMQLAWLTAREAMAALSRASN